MFRMLGGETRLRILDLLGRSPLTVGEIARRLGVSQPAASQHLAQLRDTGLIRDRREGQSVVYEVVPAAYARYRLGTRAFGWHRSGPKRPEQTEAYREFLRSELDRVDRELESEQGE
jgi:DNA-binding transcriptional ArsR family regulator